MQRRHSYAPVPPEPLPVMCFSDTRRMAKFQPTARKAQQHGVCTVVTACPVRGVVALVYRRAWLLLVSRRCKIQWNATDNLPYLPPSQT